MKKTRINIFIYIAAVLSLLLSGCSGEDTYQEGTNDAARTTLSLQVNATAYHSSVGARASDTGTATTFTDGDRLGIIVTHPDNSVEHFVYTYSGYYASWSTSNPAYYDSRDSYAAYYPYREALRGKSLADVKSAFTPLSNQSDYVTGYTLSDLMTCEKATIGANKSLQITLTHEFSMLCMPTGVPVKSKCEDNNTYQYPFPVTDVIFYIGDTPYRAWVGRDGYARVIVGSNNSNSSNINVKSSYIFQGKRIETGATVAAFVPGRYYTVTPPVQDLGDYEFSDARIGDFYCRSSNGSGFILPREGSSLLNGLNCVGIVFYAGKHESDDSDYSKPLTAGGPCIPKGTNGETQVHGYVMALTDVNQGGSDRLRWEYKANGDGSYTYNQAVGASTTNSDWKGYSNQQQFHTFLGTDAGNGWQMSDFPAAYGCELYGTVSAPSWQQNYAAPSNSSGWFLPSCGQLGYLYNNRSDLSTRINNIKEVISDSNIKWFSTSSYYWSSSEGEDYSDRAWRVYFGYGDSNASYKGDTDDVRAVCAF